MIFGVFAVQGAWPTPDVNEPYYLGRAVHYWNPDWLRGDFFMESVDTHKVFYFSFGWLSMWLGPTALCWVGRIIIWFLLAWSWRRLSVALIPRPWYAILTAALFGCLMERCHMAGEWVIGGAEAKGFAYCFVFLGLESLIRNHWNRALWLFGAGGAFHVLVGGWSAVAAALGWLRLKIHSTGQFNRRVCLPRDAADFPCGGQTNPLNDTLLPKLLQLWPGILGGLLLALPGLLPSLLLDWGVDAETKRQAHQIYVFERLPHHLVLSGIRPDFIVRLCLLWGVWLILGRWSRRCGSGCCLLRAFVTGAVTISFIGVAIHGLLWVDKSLAAELLRYYWFRLTDMALPLGVSLEVTALTAGGNWALAARFWRRAALTLAILVAAFHLGDRTIDRLAPAPPRSHRIADFPAWLDACRWVVESGKVPPHACFLTPRLASTFKWYTNRNEVACWKDVPQDAESIVQWWRRICDLHAGEPLPPNSRWHKTLASQPPDRLRELGARYGADYAISEAPQQPIDLPIAYSNRTYVIFRLK